MAKKKDGNGLWDPTDHPDPAVLEAFNENPPTSPEEAKKLGVNVYLNTETGEYVKMRYKGRAPNRNGLKIETGSWENYQDMRSRNSRQRRASEKGKTISQSETEDFLKRNLYSNPEKTAQQILLEDKQKRQAIKKRAAATNQIYEHLDPLANPNSGFEVSRNIVAAPAEPNSIKSDKIASRDVYRSVGVPSNRQEAIRQMANNVPVGGDKERFGKVFADIQSNARPSARSIKPTDINIGGIKVSLYDEVAKVARSAF